MTKRELIEALEQFDTSDDIDVVFEGDPMRCTSNMYFLSRVVRVAETYGDSADLYHTVERLVIR